jgi:NAD(P)H-hydrate epimerase
VMAKLVSVSEMLAIEQAADKSGLSYARLMENAGRSLANAVIAHSHKSNKSVLGLAGSGNNGGDTLVALELLAKKGWQATAYLVKRDMQEKHVKRAKKAGVSIVASDKSGTKLSKLIPKHVVLLDGLLGTGIHLPLREPFATVLAGVKEILGSMAHPPFIVAVDCPSGMDTDSGEIPAEMLKANLTVSMAAVKRGMLTLPAFDHLGKLVVGDIDLPPDLPEWTAIQRYAIDEEIAHSAIPPRPLKAHKGTFGTALIVAGSDHFPGAALLAGEAAYRSGVGLVTVATPETIQPSLAGHLREATWLPLPADSGWISAAAADLVRSALDRVTALLVGPGFGQQLGTQQFIDKLLDAKLPPTVIDADALKLLARIDDWPRRLPADTILTPHPGEMSILSGLSTDEIQSARTEVAEKHAQQWKVVLVLKGAFTVVASPDGRSATLSLATPALARAGTGDVLAGIITGLRAQGVTAFEAACTAVWLHGHAGLRAAALMGGTAGVLAGDLIAEIPDLIGV